MDVLILKIIFLIGLVSTSIIRIYYQREIKQSEINFAYLLNHSKLDQDDF